MEASIMVSKAEILKATIIATEALKFMAEKAGVSPETILITISTDPIGNTARYFKSLTSEAMAKC